MKNADFSKVLKQYRKLNKLSVKEVVKILESKSVFVAEKTVYGWESGQTNPSADTLLLLCEIYNIDNILATFGYSKKEPFNISVHEEELIRQYRKHPQFQSAVDKLLDV